MPLDGWFMTEKVNGVHQEQGKLTPVVLHASRSGRHSPLCFCSGGPPNPPKNKNKTVLYKWQI